MSTGHIVGGIDLEVLRRGAGRPVLLLHGMQPVDPRAPFLEMLGRHAEIIAPSHPGFGRSARPKDFETVYDLVHFYLEFLDSLPHEKLTLMGFSFGGWLAAELAVKFRRRTSWTSSTPRPRKWSGGAGTIPRPGRPISIRCPTRSS